MNEEVTNAPELNVDKALTDDPKSSAHQVVTDDPKLRAEQVGTDDTKSSTGQVVTDDPKLRNDKVGTVDTKTNEDQMLTNTQIMTEYPELTEDIVLLSPSCHNYRDILDDDSQDAEARSSASLEQNSFCSPSILSTVVPRSPSNNNSLITLLPPGLSSPYFSPSPRTPSNNNSFRPSGLKSPYFSPSPMQSPSIFPDSNTTPQMADKRHYQDGDMVYTLNYGQETDPEHFQHGNTVFTLNHNEDRDQQDYQQDYQDENVYDLSHGQHTAQEQDTDNIQGEYFQFN